MSVQEYVAGDLFRVTVVKYLAANPDRKWANNYEMRAKSAGDLVALNNMAFRFFNFEKAFHLNSVRFDRVRTSTWEADSKPYDPDVFSSLPVSGIGLLDTVGSDPVAINNCLDLARVPTSGRFGHLYYRGALREIDIIAPAGKSVLDNPAYWTNLITNALDESTVGVFVDGTDSDWEMVMVGKTEASARIVANFTIRGVAVVPFNHAWFNRTTTETVSP